MNQTCDLDKSEITSYCHTTTNEVRHKVDRCGKICEYRSTTEQKILPKNKKIKHACKSKHKTLVAWSAQKLDSEGLTSFARHARLPRCRLQRLA